MRILENVVRRVLEEVINHPMELKKGVKVSDELRYHLDKKIPLSKMFSESILNLFLN